MIKYLATQILEGALKYSSVFSIKIYQQFKEGVDAILIAAGRADLIEEIAE